MPVIGILLLVVGWLLWRRFSRQAQVPKTYVGVAKEKTATVGDDRLPPPEHLTTVWDFITEQLHYVPKYEGPSVLTGETWAALAPRPSNSILFGAAISGTMQQAVAKAVDLEHERARRRALTLASGRLIRVDKDGSACVEIGGLTRRMLVDGSLAPYDHADDGL